MLQVLAIAGMGRRSSVSRARPGNYPKPSVPTTTKRAGWNFARLALVLAAAFFAASSALATDGWHVGKPPPGRLDYVVTRGGTPIGRQTIEFRDDGDGLVVRTRVDVEVDFLSMTLYRLHHEAEEHWSDGRLVALTSRTDDDGKDREVTLVAEDGRLKGRYNDNPVDLPGDLIPASLWHPATVSATVLLDPIRGRERHVTVVDRGLDRVNTTNGVIEARRYSMTGQIERDLWYDSEGKLVLVRFPAKDGSQITATLQQESATSVDAADRD